MENTQEKQTFASFVKKYFPEIIFFTFFALSMFSLLFNGVTLKFKDANGESVRFGIRFFNVLFGGTLTFGEFGTYTFSPDIFLIVTSILICISFALFLSTIFIKNEGTNIPKCTNIVLDSINLIVLSIEIISLLFINFIYSTSVGTILGENPAYREVENDYFFLVYMLIVFGGMILVLLGRILDKNKYDIRTISEIAMLIALALVLDKIKIPMGATGGSINMSALPLFIIALRHGALKGFIASSIIFGFISCLFDGYGMQFFPFDYLIAFSGYATIGLFYKLFKQKKLSFMIYSILLGGVVSLLTRYLGSCISSIVYYGYNVVDAIIYNSLYVPASVGVSIGITLALSPAIFVLNKKYSLRKI